MSVSASFNPGINVGDVLDYTWDFSAFMVTDDTIVSAVVSGVPDDLTISDAVITGNAVTVFVSNASLDMSYDLTCEIVTTGGRTAGRSVVLNCIKL